MRHFFVALMIVLLPLRGWAGDVMATQMAAPALAQQVAQIAGTSTHNHESGTPSHTHSDLVQAGAATLAPDCAGHAGSGHSSPTDNSHCQSCVACQACHTLGLAVPSIVSTEPASAAEKPQLVVSRFTSAERALGLKPPIS